MVTEPAENLPDKKDHEDDLAPAAVNSAAGRLLTLLHLLHLLRMSLLHLLRLLSMLLLLLLGSLGSLLPGDLLILFVLRLLEFLPLLILLSDQLVLLLLVFLVRLRIPRVRSCASDRRQLIRMDRGVGASGRRRWRGTMVRRKFLLRTIMGRPLMLRLSRHRPNMFTAGSGLFFR